MTPTASSKSMGPEAFSWPSVSLGHASLRKRCDRTHRGSFRYSARHHEWHSGDPHQIACGHGELELLINSLQATQHRLSKASDGLTPAKVLLDSLAHDLAQPAGTDEKGPVAKTGELGGLPVITRHLIVSFV